MAAPKPCSLLRLPPELRNQVYELVLLSPREKLITKNEPSPALLRTCQQIRDEASSLHYGQNIFLITNAESLCIKWLASLPRSMRTHIKTLRLHTNCTASGSEAASYKKGLLDRLYATLQRRELGDHITLEVFVTLDRKLEPNWTSDPMLVCHCEFD